MYHSSAVVASGCKVIHTAFLRASSVRLPCHATFRGCSHAPKAQKSAPRFQRDSEKKDAPIHDGSVVSFGKYEGKRFSEVYETEANYRDWFYCDWMIKQALSGTRSLENFDQLLIYVLHRRLREAEEKLKQSGTAAKEQERLGQRGTAAKEQDSLASESEKDSESERDTKASLPTEVWGTTDALESKLFVISGYSPAVSRVQVESMIKFFGGGVRTAVTSKTDYLVVVGGTLEDWRGGSSNRSVETSQKFQKALAQNVTIIASLEELLSLIRSASEEQFMLLGGSAKLVCFQSGDPSTWSSEAA